MRSYSKTVVNRGRSYGYFGVECNCGCLFYTINFLKTTKRLSVNCSKCGSSIKIPIKLPEKFKRRFYVNDNGRLVYSGYRRVSNVEKNRRRQAKRVKSQNN